MGDVGLLSGSVADPSRPVEAGSELLMTFLFGPASTTGFWLPASLSAMLTVSLEDDPTVYAALLASVRTTVSVPSAAASSTGVTVTVALDELSGIVTLPEYAPSVQVTPVPLSV